MMRRREEWRRGNERRSETELKKLSWRRTQPYAVVSTAIVNNFFGGDPYGATNRARGVPKCVEWYTTRTKTIDLST